MSKQQHTPGPWNCEQPGNTLPLSGIVRDKNNNPVCDCTYIENRIVKNRAEEDANARLIAAAPELLEALKEATALLDEHEPQWYLKGHYNRFTKAISKAEGGAHD